MTPGGLPHSGIHGSTLADNSPWHIAAIHALHRLARPTHPPPPPTRSAPPDAPCRANRIELYQSLSSFVDEPHSARPSARRLQVARERRPSLSDVGHTSIRLLRYRARGPLRLAAQIAVGSSPPAVSRL